MEVTSKGNKTRLVPPTDELIAELAHYRRAKGLAPTPQPGEARPLVLLVIGRESRGKPLPRGALHLILKEVFGMAAERLRARGPEWEAQAAVLASASASLAAPHRPKSGAGKFLPKAAFCKRKT